MDKRLSIVAVEQKSQDSPDRGNSKLNRRQTAQAKFNQLWLDNPNQFDPERNCIERERLKRTLELLKRHVGITGKYAVDLGCGRGTLAKLLKAEGAVVDAVDISNVALKPLKDASVKENNPGKINAIEDFVPATKLADDSYDIVLSTELIGYLPKEERRLYFAELSRLVKTDGYVICSTGLDIHTDDALQAFVDLVETEFHPLEWRLSSHAFLISIKNFLKTPENYAKGSKDQNFRQQEIAKRRGFKRYWYQLNSSWFPGVIWKLVSYFTNPVLNLFEQNRTLMLLLENLCRVLKSNSGISHVIFIGQRRPLIIPTQEELMAIEPKHKRQVWE